MAPPNTAKIQSPAAILQAALESGVCGDGVKKVIMCGLVGILGCKGPDEERRELIHAMAGTMVHRGPDGEGYVARDDCALGFRGIAALPQRGPFDLVDL
jgi:hypothetical protein